MIQTDITICIFPSAKSLVADGSRKVFARDRNRVGTFFVLVEQNLKNFFDSPRKSMAFENNTRYIID